MEINALLNSFRDYLVDSELRESIVKIVLFGSHAKGVATRDSDLDVLIVTANGVEIEHALMDKVYDFMVEHNAPIEVILSHVMDLFSAEDYFLKIVANSGVELYAMEEKNIRSGQGLDRNCLREGQGVGDSCPRVPS